MAPPASYTEATIHAYMHADLGDVAGILGWTVEADSYDEPLTNAMLEYGTDDVETISGAANITKIRRLAVYFTWRAAVPQLGLRFDQDADGADTKRSQMHKTAAEHLSSVFADAMEYLSINEVGRQDINWVEDPYVDTAITDAEDD